MLDVNFIANDPFMSSYLATVYYAKTQNASQLSPFNKWQTYVFVGDTQVNASLIQATDDNAEPLYVNKYGEIQPERAVSDFLVNGKTQMFSLDDLTDTRTSEPAGGMARASGPNAAGRYQPAGHVDAPGA